MPRKKSVPVPQAFNSRGWNSTNNAYNDESNPKGGSAPGTNISLPGKIKCGICLKWRQPQNFSKRQMKVIGTNIRRFGPQAGVASLNVSCTSCMSGGNRLEWTCAQCHVCKDIDSFSKVQRGLGDEAICQECMNKVMSLDPTETNGHDDPHEDESSSDSEDDDDDATTIANSMSSYSHATAATSSNVAGHWDDQGVSVEQFLDSDFSSLATSSVVTDNASITSSKAEAILRQQRNGEIGWDDSASQAGSKYKKSNYTQSTNDKGRKWAKVRATDDYQDPNPPPANSASFAAIKAVGTAAALEYQNNSRYGGTNASSKGGQRSDGPAPKTDKWGKVKSSTATKSTSYGAEPLADSDDSDDDDWATQVYDYHSGDDGSE